MDKMKKFDGRAESYTHGRTGYSEKLIDCIYCKYGISQASVIADVGSGTGKFSKQLIERRSTVYCVEPSDDMRHTAEKELCEYNNFYSVAGTAENTTLNDDFADFVTVAQAFHWFDVHAFKNECRRIIKKRGKVFLIWNIRDCNDIVNQEWYEIFLRYCPDFNGFGNGIKKDDIKIKEFFDRGYAYESFENDLFFDRKKFIERSLSSSYSLKYGDVNYDNYISELNKLFDKYENSGVLRIPNNSVAYIGEVK